MVLVILLISLLFSKEKIIKINGKIIYQDWKKVIYLQSKKRKYFKNLMNKNFYIYIF